jgi:glutamate carboxypeptidase
MRPGMREVLARLEARREEQIGLLRELVNLDSGTDDRADTQRVGDLLAGRLDALGFRLRREPGGRYADHVVGERPGRGRGRLLLVGHFDTVFPSGTAARRPFRVAGDRATGPGVYDMKGGLAVLLHALGAHREAASRTWSETPITVVLNADEERLSPSSRAVIEAEARRADAVGILEPARPGGEVVVARKGAGTFRLEIEGRAAHAGLQPELGASAIEALGRKIAELADLTDRERGVTVNVGVVGGGQRPNVVAPSAWAEIDLRAWSTEDAAWATAAIHAIAERAHVPGTRARLAGGLAFPPWPPGLPGTGRLLALLVEAGREVGVEVRGIATGGGSDGNHTAAVAPTIDGLGPQGNRAHSDEEFVILPTLHERTRLLAAFLACWTDAAGAA